MTDALHLADAMTSSRLDESTAATAAPIRLSRKTAVASHRVVDDATAATERGKARLGREDGESGRRRRVGWRRWAGRGEVSTGGTGCALLARVIECDVEKPVSRTPTTTTPLSVVDRSSVLRQGGGSSSVAPRPSHGRRVFATEPEWCTYADYSHSHRFLGSSIRVACIARDIRLVGSPSPPFNHSLKFRSGQIVFL